MENEQVLPNKGVAILHICLSKGWGGLEMYPIRIGKEFVKKNHQVYALCLSGSKVAKGMKEAGIETFEVKSKKHLVFNELKRLNAWLKKRNVGIIHSHKSRDILASSLLSVLTTRKSFFTEHMGGRKPKKDFVHKFIYHHLSRVFSISKETYQRNLRALPVPANKITQLWLGTDTNLIANPDAIKHRLNLSSNPFIIGCVGRLIEGKGQLDLLNAFKIVLQSYPNCQLLLLGGLTTEEGADENFVNRLYKEIESNQLAEKVHLLGFHQDTFSALNMMDVVCIPSHDEAFGLTAIEAMAATKAIIASNSGALPEIFEHTALYAKPHDSHEFAEQIIKYIESEPLRITNAQKARERAVEHFSMEKHIDSLLSYYSQEN